VILDGEDASVRHVRERQVGFVFQHYALFKHMSVFDNIAFGLRVKPRALRLSEEKIRDKVMRLLSLVQLDWLADRYPSQLSGGQRQRIALARALAVEPRVLLLDGKSNAISVSKIAEIEPVLKALEIMKASKVHMAFLVDEFGAFEGVVTATDLLEMIAGDFDEGHDDAEVNVRLREDGTWLVDGQTDIDELADTLGEDFGEADGFHTVAGLVLHHLSRVPGEGEILQLGRFEVEIIDMDDRRIDKLLFRAGLPGRDASAAETAGT
jgi:CBS domain-containing protein